MIHKLKNQRKKEKRKKNKRKERNTRIHTKTKYKYTINVCLKESSSKINYWLLKCRFQDKRKTKKLNRACKSFSVVHS